MIQLTLVFMAGYALSQFSTGFIAEKCGTWPSLRFATKVLILSGMIASSAGTITKWLSLIHI